MGVNGLWSLLAPVARPVPLESLEKRRLAIDASIWLYQFQIATRDRKTGDTLQGAHVMGTFRRIMKLLYHGVKPVFVFDGDAPMLKRRTLEQRRRRKEGAGRDLKKTAEQLLSAQLRSLAAEAAIKEGRRSKGNAAGPADPTMEDTGDQIGPDAVYLEDLEGPIHGHPAPKKTPTPAPETPSPVKKKYVYRDEYALPTIDSLESRLKATDSRLATAEEERDFFDELRPEFFDSEEFAGLTTQQKYEIIGEQRVKSRQVNHRRVQQMKNLPTPLDFSNSQISNLVERNLYTQKLFAVTDELGQSAIQIPTRVAGERNLMYELVKQDPSKGTGFVLAIKNPDMGSTAPIVIEDSSDEDGSSAHTDSDDFEEVSAEPVSHTPDPDARRALALEAIRSRYAPTGPEKELDPYLDQPTNPNMSNTLFPDDFAHEFDEAEDPELQTALQESALLSKISEAIQARERQGGYGSAVAGPSGLSAAQKAAPAEAVDEDSDDSLEYVDVPTRGKSPVAQSAPEVVPSITIHDSDDSDDDFEEVQVSHASAAASAPPAKLPSPSPPPAPQVFVRKSLMDSVLSSDEEDADDDLRASASKPSPRRNRSSPHKPVAIGQPHRSLSPIGPLRPEQRTSRLQPPTAPMTSNDREEIDVTASEPTPAQEDVLMDDYEIDVQMDEPAIVSPEPSFSHAVSALPPAPSLGPSPSPPPLSIGSDSPPPPVTTPLDLQDRASTIPEPVAFAEPLPEAASVEPSPPLPSPDVSETPASEALNAESRQQSISNVHDESSEPATATALAEDEDEEEFFSDWERSPSPPPREKARQAPVAIPDDAPNYEEEPDYEDEEELEIIRGMQREADQYADLASQLKNRRLEDMRDEAASEVAKLTAKRNAELRSSDGITRQMATDIKDMLDLFGIPYVDAPQEAEAECADLLMRQLVDGIVTDDSDVFLFGGGRVYRHMFNDKKYVECYILDDLDRELGLDRDKLVRLAYLLGGDYADGLPGVGPVLARELLEEFDGKNGLEQFKAWWAKVQSGRDTKDDTSTAWRRKFKKGHQKLVIDASWPNPEISQAYYKPVVHDSDERFEWGTIDLDGLRSFLTKTLTWTSSKTDEIVLPLIGRQKSRSEGKLLTQGVLSDFFDISGGSGPLPKGSRRVGYGSARLQNVLKTVKRKRGQSISDDEAKEEASTPALSEDDMPAPPKRAVEPKGKGNGKAESKGKTGTTTASGAHEPIKRTTAASRKRAEKARRDARAAERGGEYSSEEDLGVSTIPRGKAPTRKATKRPAREVVSTSESDDSSKRRKKGGD